MVGTHSSLIYASPRIRACKQSLEQLKILLVDQDAGLCALLAFTLGQSGGLRNVRYVAKS
jgi:hypothetical protein